MVPFRAALFWALPEIRRFRASLFWTLPEFGRHRATLSAAMTEINYFGAGSWHFVAHVSTTDLFGMFVLHTHTHLYMLSHAPRPRRPFLSPTVDTHPPVLNDEIGCNFIYGWGACDVTCSTAADERPHRCVVCLAVKTASPTLITLAHNVCLQSLP
jgi:hypothetical protein